MFPNKTDEYQTGGGREMQYNQKVIDGYFANGTREMFHRSYILYPSLMQEVGNIDIYGAKALDVGCGDGYVSRMLARKGAIVLGCDNSPGMIERAKKKERNDPFGINYIQYDANKLSDLKGSFFKLVTAAMLIHYAKTIDELRMIIGGMSHILEDEGCLIALNSRLDKPVKKNDSWTGTEAKWIGKPFKDGSEILISIHDRNGKLTTSFKNYYWTEETYRRVFEEAGFSSVDFKRARLNKKGKDYITRAGWPISFEEFEDLMVLMVITAQK